MWVTDFSFLDWLLHVMKIKLRPSVSLHWTTKNTLRSAWSAFQSWPCYINTLDFVTIWFHFLLKGVFFYVELSSSARCMSQSNSGSTNGIGWAISQHFSQTSPCSVPHLQQFLVHSCFYNNNPISCFISTIIPFKGALYDIQSLSVIQKLSTHDSQHGGFWANG